MTNAEARCNKSLRPRKPEGSLGRTAQDVHLDSHTAPELCAGIKMEGLLYPASKIRHRWPRIWNKRRICNRIRKAALPCPCIWTAGRLVIYSSANWPALIGYFGQWLHTGKETTAPHYRTKTQYQRTIDWTKNILIFSTSKLTKTISPTRSD